MTIALRRRGFCASDVYKQWKDVLSVDLDSVFLCCSQVIPAMRQQNGGRIINIASGSAYGNVGQANYSAAKAGILGFTRTLALESECKNITVNAINPGFTETDIIQTVPESVLTAARNANPMRRLGKPEDIAALVLFLAGEEASYINGQIINCNGGSR
ncbi:MAG: SDR family oxidoreductase [Oscillospiraceae bacterium]|nr:SDR family oxidoreductase [Oscillospiraceae bacterium]